MIPLLVLAVSAITALTTRSRVKSWLTVVLFVAGWAIAVSIPLIFIGEGNLAGVKTFELNVSSEGLDTVLSFVCRVVAASAIFTSFALALGWRKTVAGLSGLGIPREVARMLTLAAINIPFFLRLTLKMLAAREARLVKKAGVRESWRVLASIAGDVLIKGYSRAWILDKAVAARSFPATGNPVKKGERIDLKVKDIALVALPVFMVALAFTAGLWP